MANSRFYAPSVTGISPPAYMRKRQNFPGPLAGLLTCVSFGPLAVASGDSLTVRAAHISPGPSVARLSGISKAATGGPAYGIGGFRPIAVSWYARAVSGAGPTLTIKARAGASAGSSGSTILNAVALNTNPSGVAYFGGETGSTAAASHDTKSAGVTDALYSSPDFVVTAGSQPWILCAVTGGGQTVDDLSVVVWGFVTAHINADKAND